MRIKVSQVKNCFQYVTAQWFTQKVDSSWNVMAHGDTREGKWRRNWRMEWVANTLHTTSEHGVSSITNAGAQTSAASRRLNWRPRRFKRTRPFRGKTKYVFCACAITFQTQSTRGELWSRSVSDYTVLTGTCCVLKSITPQNHTQNNSV